MKSKILFIASLLFGLMYINAGLNKFFNYLPVPKDLPAGMIKLMSAFNDIGWLLPLIGLTEIVGGILVITKKFRALGAIIILPVMAGVLLTHSINERSGLPIAIVLMGINIWIIIENRNKYLPMIQ